MIRRAYRLAAAGCAELVWRVPAFERPFRRLGVYAWPRPWIGHIYRSIADRVAQRIRLSGRRFRSVTIGKIPLVLDVTEFTTKTMYFGLAAYEPATTNYLCQHLQRGNVFIDIGANHGYFSVLAAALVGDVGRVVAFEPNPSVFEQLRTHVCLNGFAPRVTMVRAALSNVRSDAARLFVSQPLDNSGLSSLTPAPLLLEQGLLSAAHTVPVRVDMFDSWFTVSGFEHVDMVKIDVEGAEDCVLHGMSATLASGRIGTVVCETEWESSAHRKLCDAGFVPQLLETMGPRANIVYSQA